MKEEKKGLILFFLFLEGESKNRVLWREGEHSGAFIKILYCTQDHKWNAKQGWGSEQALAAEGAHKHPPLLLQ